MKLFQNFFKLFFFIFFFSFSFQVRANRIIVPEGFYKEESAKGVTLYMTEKGEDFVLVVDVSSGAKLIHKTFGVSDGKYLRKEPSSRLLDKGAFALVNGTFFQFGGGYDFFIHSRSEDYRKVMFPFTPGNTTWNDTANTRTLCIKSNKKITIDDAKKVQRNYSNACIFSLTLLSPIEDKDRDDKVGRNYIGVTKDGTKVLFFVSYARTQAEMESIVKSWGIPHYHIIMGDGSGSAQLVTKKNAIFGYTAFGSEGRSVPHMIQIFPFK